MYWVFKPAPTTELEGCEVGEGGPEAGTPDDGVGLGARAIRPCHAPRNEAGEHRARLEQAAVTGFTDARDGDDVAEGGDAAGVGAAFVECAAAGGGGVEQGAAVDVVGQEAGRALGDTG